MGNTALRVVLAGTGGWARAHALAIKDVSELELAGIVGHSDLRKLSDFAAEFKVQDASLDLSSTVRKTKPDILDVACNPHYRVPAVSIACREGIPTVNTEKPMALTPSEAGEIVRLCRKHDLKFTVNHQKKFMLGWRDAEKHIADGALGKINLVRASCQGNLLEQGTHLIDMVLFFNRYSRPKWIVGQIGELSGLNKEGASAPDMALAETELENGVRCVLDFGTLGHDFPGAENKWWQFGVEVYGDKGVLTIGLCSGLNIRFFDGRAPIFVDTNWDRDYHNGLVAHFKELVSYSRGEKDHVSNLENSLLSFNLIMGIYQSALNREKISFPCAFPPDLLDKLRAR